jgi:hypothetical protein
VATVLGLKAPPTTYWSLKPDNPTRVSAISRDGNPPVAFSAVFASLSAPASPDARTPFSSLPTIVEDEERAPKSWSSAKAIRNISFCLSIASLLPAESPGSLRDFFTNPRFEVLRAKVQLRPGEASDEYEDKDMDEDSVHEDDDDSDNEDADFPSCSSFSLDSLLAKVEICEPVGVEQDLASPLRPAPLTIRKKMVEVPPAAHPESQRVPVTYPKGAARSLHPAMQALCDHFNA